jgi:hypothetical protein
MADFKPITDFSFLKNEKTLTAKLFEIYHRYILKIFQHPWDIPCDIFRIFVLCGDIGLLYVYLLIDVLALQKFY